MEKLCFECKVNNCVPISSLKVGDMFIVMDSPNSSSGPIFHSSVHILADCSSIGIRSPSEGFYRSVSLIGSSHGVVNTFFDNKMVIPLIIEVSIQEDTQNKDTQNEDTQNEDTQNETTYINVKDMEEHSIFYNKYGVFFNYKERSPERPGLSLSLFTFNKKYLPGTFLYSTGMKGIPFLLDKEGKL